MPEVYDFDEWDQISVEFTVSQDLQQLVSYDMDTSILQIKGLSDSLIGEYDLTFTIKDNKDGMNYYELTIVVIRPEAFQGVVIEEFKSEETE